jgi:SAM-dependent methyltransferase
VSERRLTFGGVAELYDRARPSYPVSLVEDVIELAGADRALEVGAGTGKATVLFAERGVSVVALEPSAEMAAVARANCARYPTVRIEQLDFERWEPGGERFPLLYAAQAWHWVRPEERYPRAREALIDGGLVAPFWTRVRWEECPLREALRAAYDGAGAEQTPSDAMDPRRPADDDWQARWKREIDGAAGFHQPETRVYHWTQDYSTDEYVALLSTHSAQLIRDAPAREALLGAIRETIIARGGAVRIPYATELCLARARAMTNHGLW